MYLLLAAKVAFLCVVHLDLPSCYVIYSAVSAIANFFPQSLLDCLLTVTDFFDWLIEGF